MFEVFESLKQTWNHFQATAYSKRFKMYVLKITISKDFIKEEEDRKLLTISMLQLQW